MQPDHAAHCVSVPLAGCRGSTSRAAMKFGRGVATPNGACSRLDTALYTRNALARGKGVMLPFDPRSEEHTSELQSIMRTSYALFCLKKKKLDILNSNSRTAKNTHTDYYQVI